MHKHFFNDFCLQFHEKVDAKKSTRQRFFRSPADPILHVIGRSPASLECRGDSGNLRLRSRRRQIRGQADSSWVVHSKFIEIRLSAEHSESAHSMRLICARNPAGRLVAAGLRGRTRIPMCVCRRPSDQLTNSKTMGEQPTLKRIQTLTEPPRLSGCG